MTAMERIAGLAPKRGPPAERIDIIHFDLAGSIADIPPGIPGTEVLIIFWRGDIPAGPCAGFNPGRPGTPACR
jgi:hypothetical protein